MITRDDGTTRLKELRDRQATMTQNRERQNLFNRLHVILMSAPGHDRAVTTAWLPEIEQMPKEERAAAIREKFGEQVLARCLPSLAQLEHVGL